MKESEASIHIEEQPAQTRENLPDISVHSVVVEPSTEQSRWRTNWFVKNCLSPLPMVGGFFKTANVKKALHHMGYSTSMLLGGASMMMLNPTNIQVDNSAEEKFAKMTANMALGMVGAVVVYGTLFSIAQKVSSLACQRSHEQVAQVESEQSALVRGSAT